MVSSSSCGKSSPWGEKSGVRVRERGRNSVASIEELFFAAGVCITASPSVTFSRDVRSGFPPLRFSIIPANTEGANGVSHAALADWMLAVHFPAG